MAQNGYQKGYVRRKMTKEPYWQGVHWEYAFVPGGAKVKVRRSRRLGLVKDLNKHAAEKLLLEILAEYNSRQYEPLPIPGR